MSCQVIENSMVALGITPAEYTEDDHRPTQWCGDCGSEIDPDAAGTVENKAGVFCNSVCNARALYEATDNATGKAALMRFVAALYLLSEEDVLSRAPQMAWDKFDMEYVNRSDAAFNIENLREQAMALLRTFDVEGSVDWSRVAIEMAAELGERIGKAAC